MTEIVVWIIVLIIGIVAYLITSRNDSKDAVTFFSYVHALVGFIVGRYQLMSFEVFVILHIAFEIWENSESGIAFFSEKDKIVKEFRDKFHIDFTWSSYGGDTVINSNCDNLSAIFGYLFGSASRNTNTPTFSLINKICSGKCSG